jgi:hypothetical protein
MEIIQEANRYLDNARQILSEKANKENGLYQDINIMLPGAVCVGPQHKNKHTNG